MMAMETMASPLLSELNKARYVNPIDWDSPKQNAYEKTFLKGLKIHVEKKESSWEWKLLHDRAGLINSGDSESLSVAALEAITYAEHKVKNNMLSGLLS
jgi:hypothetical protein